MASIKNLKKNFNYAIYDIVEEAFSQQLHDKSKTDKMDAVIDDAADFQVAMLSKMNATKDKKSFSALITEIEDGVEQLAEKLM